MPYRRRSRPRRSSHRYWQGELEPRSAKAYAPPWCRINFPKFWVAGLGTLRRFARFANLTRFELALVTAVLRLGLSFVLIVASKGVATVANGGTSTVLSPSCCFCTLRFVRHVLSAILITDDGDDHGDFDDKKSESFGGGLCRGLQLMMLGEASKPPQILAVSWLQGGGIC